MDLGIPCALDKDKNIILISEAQRKTEYFCSGCGNNVTPVMGKVYTHHFRHKVSSDFNSFCSESALHLYCKNLIKSNGFISVIDKDLSNEPINLILEQIELEKRINIDSENYLIPDVFAKSKYKGKAINVWVEIVVSNGVNEVKKEFIRNQYNLIVVNIKTPKNYDVKDLEVEKKYIISHSLVSIVDSKFTNIRKVSKKIIKKLKSNSLYEALYLKNSLRKQGCFVSLINSSHRNYVGFSKKYSFYDWVDDNELGKCLFNPSNTIIAEHFQNKKKLFLKNRSDKREKRNTNNCDFIDYFTKIVKYEKVFSYSKEEKTIELYHKKNRVIIERIEKIIDNNCEPLACAIRNNKLKDSSIIESLKRIDDIYLLIEICINQGIMNYHFLFKVCNYFRNDFLKVKTYRLPKFKDSRFKSLVRQNVINDIIASLDNQDIDICYSESGQHEEFVEFLKTFYSTQIKIYNEIKQDIKYNIDLDDIPYELYQAWSNGEEVLESTLQDLTDYILAKRKRFYFNLLQTEENENPIQKIN